MQGGGNLANAIVARENGDNYQRMVLWHHITKLIHGDSDYKRLFTEHPEIKSFDDIVVEYKQPAYKHGHRCIGKEFIQTKFHQYESDTITLDNLMLPSFVNSTKFSFLQKLKSAYKQLGDNYNKCAFTLYSPFDVAQDDILYSAIANIDGFINLDKIFDGSVRTPRAKAIEKMKKHLQVDNEELKMILGQFRFYRGPRYPELIDSVNLGLGVLSFEKISNSSAINPYVSLASKWLSGGISEITPEFIYSECSAEGLIAKSNTQISKLAIKTFRAGTKYLVENNIETLDLSDSFEGGNFLSSSLWPDIKNKIFSFCDHHDVLNQYEIYLECSFSVGFIAGRIFNPKSGCFIYPVQKTADGLQSWNYYNGSEIKQIEDTLLSELIEVPTPGTNDSILVISITHDIECDVQEYLREEGVEYSKLLKFKHKKIGNYAINDGRQCLQIAEYIASLLNRRSRTEKMALTHIFVAAPVSLLFYLGKYSLSFGKLQLYEHDLHCSKNKAYWKSVSYLGGE